MTTTAEALDAFLDIVDYPPEDPRSVMAACARKLATAIDRAPNATLSKELRTIIDWMGETPNQAPGIVDELRAKRASRRVHGMLDQIHGIGS